MPIIPPIARPTIAPNVTATIWLEVSDYEVAAGTTLYADGIGSVFQATNGFFAGLDLTISGTVWSRGGGVLGAQNFGAIVNNGIAVAEGVGNSQVQTFSPGWFKGLTNNGSIYALSGGYGTALAIRDSGGFFASPIINSGIIASQSGIDGASYAIWRENGGHVHNLASGSILAEGGFSGAVRIDRGSTNSTAPAEVINEGLIEAVSLFAGHQ